MNNHIVKSSKYALLLFLLFIAHSCLIDHGLEPVNSKISGKIIFHGTPPASTDEVRVAVVKHFPPSNIKSLLFSNMINFKQDTAEYELYISEGYYEAVAVIWKEHNQSWNISNVIGVYGGGIIDGIIIPTFTPVIIPDNNTIIKGVDIHASLDRVNRNAKITGTVHFKGKWPENTGIIAVGAFSKIPNPDNYIDYYFSSIFIDYSIQTFVSSSDYLLRVHAMDSVKYIAALWIDNTYDLTGIQDAGFYCDPEDTSGTTPGIVVVPENSTIENIDFTVDFRDFDE